jgi:biopolymer transport protein ExbD
MESRKPLDAELNLVPFIDLLSCCISFLLITAVWTQVDGLAAHTGGEGGDLVALSAPALVLIVDGDGYRVKDGDSAITIPKRGSRYDREVLLQRLRQTRGDRNAIEVAGADGIRYEDLVGAMDTAYGAGLPDVSMTAL